MHILLHPLRFPVLVLTLLVGCSQNAAYRTDYNLCPYSESGDCAENALQLYAPDHTDEYQLGFIEFDDQGQLRDRQQMYQVLDNYRAIAGVKDILLVVFIHGWHHNAAPEDGNVMEFRKLLTKLSAAESNSDSARKVLGVYIGWRGRSIEVPVINFLTFWDRKNTSINVGQQGVTEVLLRLEEIVNIKAAMDESVPKPINSRLITIGHSFGGAVLYTSIQQILADRFIDSRKDKTFSGLANGFGDLVVLMNPAFEALRYATLYDISQSYCRRYALDQLPKLAILTSETDYATGWAFPAGRVFSTFFESHSTLQRHNCIGPGSKNINPIEIHEGDAARDTVGHFEPYLTHRLDPDSEQAERSLNFDFFNLQKRWINRKWQDPFSFERTKLLHLGTSVVHNPYLNIQVNSSLIAGHNDIWHDEIISFIRDLIMISTIPTKNKEQ